MTTRIAQNPYRETSYRALEIANRFTLQPPSGEGFFSQHELSRRHGQYASLLNIITFQETMNTAHLPITSQKALTCDGLDARECFSFVEGRSIHNSFLQQPFRNGCLEFYFRRLVLNN